MNAVRQVDVLAFGAWWRGLTGGKSELPERTRTNVLACRERDPEGCFVVEEDGRVVGIIFYRTWGGVGWFGTFAVLPTWALERLLRWGYQVERATLRMVLKGTDEGPAVDNCVNLARWAG